MKSLKVQSRLISQNNKHSVRNYLNSHGIMNMSVSSLDGFFSGVFKSLGLDINGTYTVADLFKIFNGKKIKILSVCGIECPPLEINPDIRDVIIQNNSRKKIFGNMLFSESEDRDDFYEILNRLDDSYKIVTVKILPSFTELNYNLSIKDRYTIIIFGSKSDGKSAAEPVMAVELS